MARLSRDAAAVNARIVYWGIDGAGKTTNLEAVYRKLRPDHRGELEAIPTRIDPTVRYEVLPIELGEVAGLRTRIQMVAVPGGADQAPTRKQLLDQVDGIVLVIDSQPDRLDENTACLVELRDALAAYGRRLEDVPLVIQYNKRDCSDPYTLEALYRRLDVRGAAVFEAVATDTTGVLQTLSTLSKRVIRTLRDQQFQPEPRDDAAPDVESPTVVDLDAPGPADAPPTPESASAASAAAASASASARMEEAILAEADHPESDEIASLAASTEDLLDATWEPPDDAVDAGHPDLDAPSGDDRSDPMSAAAGPLLGPELSIASVGDATRSGERSVRVPLVVADKQGRRATLVLNISLDALPDEDTG